MARKPIGRPEELTVDYRNLLSLTFVDRVNMARSAEGQAYLAALTPSQLEDLFPSYYKKYLPKSLAGAASGGIPFEGELPVPGWRLPGTEFQQRPEREKQRVAPSAVPAPSKSPEIKESWQDKIKKGLEGERQTTVGTNESAITLKDVRQKLFEQMNDTKVRNAVLARMEIEVGSQGPKAQQAWLETVMNRAASRKMSLLNAVNNSDSFYPRSDNQKFQSKTNQIEDKIQEKYKNVLSIVQDGSNIAKYATGNSSLDVGFGQGKARKVYGEEARRLGVKEGSYWAPGQTVEFSGERYGVEKYDISWAKDMAKKEEEARKKMKAATEVLPPQGPGLGDKSLQPLVPGGVEPGKAAVEPQKIVPGEIPALPQSLQDNPKFMEFYKNLSAEDKAVFPKYLENNKPENILKDMERYKKEKETQSKEQNQTAVPYSPNENFGKVSTAPDIKSLKNENLDEKFPQGQQRFFRDGGGTKGLNPKLIEVLKEASKDLPAGYHVRMFSGVDARSTGTKNHPGGVAIDLAIVDSKGKRLSDRGFGEGHKLYEQLAQSMKLRGQNMYPGTDYVWGGAWTAAGGDRMHYQIVDPNQLVQGASKNSGQYSFEKGVDPRLWAGPDAVASFMNREELKKYRESILREIQREKEAKQQQQTVVMHNEQATAVRAPSVNQTVSEGQTPNARQTGSTAKTGITKESLSPGPAIPEKTVESPPLQQRGITTYAGAEPVPENEAPPEKPVPGKFGGGEIPMKANENGIVMRNTGEVVAQINVDQEKLRTNPENGKLEVMPLRRNDPAEIQQNREQNIQSESNYAKQTSQSMENPNEVNRPTMTQEPQQNPNLRAMAEYNAAGGIPYSPSHERAMLNATTFGNSINHYGNKSTTTNLL